MGLGNFGQTAQKLAKNPLGIIALFIVLVYGIAGFVFSSAAQHLQPAERAPLIWFLVIFPVVVLFSFLWLVALHHTKLYAPEDFKNEDSFFRAMSPSEQRERIKEELQEIENDVGLTSDNATLKVIPSNFFLAEDLVIREIESEFGVNVQRNVSIQHSTPGKPKSGFFGIDAAFKSGNINYVVEIKYSPYNAFGERFDALIMRMKYFVSNFDTFINDCNLSSYIFIIVLVAESWTENIKELIQNNISKVSLSNKLSLDFRFYDLNELKSKYGLQ